MIILGIESSCDESAISLLEMDSQGRAKVIFEEVSSQIDLHALYGGVVPELAAREHLRNLPILLDNALKALAKDQSIDLVAVTQGPGLKGCLLMGSEFAKGFCLGKNLPLIPVNHIEGHIFAAKIENPELDFPFLALVVSGGHTEIVRVNGLGDYKILARTIDDAAGEAFDKSANLLGFEYPGGAKLAALADTVTSSRFTLPKVMRESNDFSFSGLKTAILLLVKKNQDILLDPSIKAELAYTIQDSIIDTLIHKLKKEMSTGEYKGITVTGGVACNKKLRSKVQEISALKVYFPSPKHCMDNATMIALVAALEYLKSQDSALKNNFSFEVKARWPVEERV